MSKEGPPRLRCKGWRGRANREGRGRHQPRYKCKACGYNFVQGAERVKESTTVKKALAVILYALGKASFGMLGKIFGVSRSLSYRWVRDEPQRLPEPVVPSGIQEMEFDEMWHFLRSKKQALDPQGGGSSHTANWGLGGRSS